MWRQYHNIATTAPPKFPNNLDHEIFPALCLNTSVGLARIDLFVATFALLYSALSIEHLEAPMSQFFTPLNSVFFTIVLATLTIGLPIVMVLSIRFLWDRNLKLGRSKDFEKLIWQLHRIASAMESQMNLSFPAVQPGTEEAQDLAFLKQLSPRANAGMPSASTSVSQSQTSTTEPALAKETATSLPEKQQASVPPIVRREPNTESPRAGVNSMFGL